MAESQNMVEALSREVHRVAELCGKINFDLTISLNASSDIRAQINAVLERAHIAFGSGDALTIIQAYQDLKRFDDKCWDSLRKQPLFGK